MVSKTVVKLNCTVSLSSLLVVPILVILIPSQDSIASICRMMSQQTQTNIAIIITDTIISLAAGMHGLSERIL